jgi:hypothetical protein
MREVDASCVDRAVDVLAGWVWLAEVMDADALASEETRDDVCMRVCLQVPVRQHAGNELRLVSLEAAAAVEGIKALALHGTPGRTTRSDRRGSMTLTAKS